MNVITKTLQLADGRTITIETGKVAKQADGSAVLRMGNTVLLATVCAAKEAVPVQTLCLCKLIIASSMLPQVVSPGGFTKREAKLTTKKS